MAAVKLTHKALVNAAYRWVLKSASCGVAFKEFYTHTCNGEYPDVIGFGSFGYSVLIECKTSRSDFLADKKKPFRRDPETGMGSRRYYCVPDGMIKPEELPAEWGLIYVSDKGKAKLRFCHFKNASGTKSYESLDKNIKAEHGLMYSALRRLHMRGHIESIYEQLAEKRINHNLLYNMQNNKSYGEALDAVKEGKRISREGWNGKGMFVFQRPGDTLTLDIVTKVKTLPETTKQFLIDRGQDVVFLPYLCMYSATGEIVNGWLASQTDMLSNDWCILD